MTIHILFGWYRMHRVDIHTKFVIFAVISEFKCVVRARIYRIYNYTKYLNILNSEEIRLFRRNCSHFYWTMA